MTKAGPIVRLNVFNADCLAASLTVIVNENVPAVDGVPLRVPLELFNVSPGGTEPTETAQA